VLFFSTSIAQLPLRNLPLLNVDLGASEAVGDKLM